MWYIVGGSSEFRLWQTGRVGMSGSMEKLMCTRAVFLPTRFNLVSKGWGSIVATNELTMRTSIWLRLTPQQRDDTYLGYGFSPDYPVYDCGTSGDIVRL